MSSWNRLFLDGSDEHDNGDDNDDDDGSAVLLLLKDDWRCRSGACDSPGNKEGHDDQDNDHIHAHCLQGLAWSLREHDHRCFCGASGNCLNASSWPLLLPLSVLCVTAKALRFVVAPSFLAPQPSQPQTLFKEIQVGA